MFPKCLGFCGWKHTSSSQKQHPTLIHELCQQFSLTDLKKSTNNFHHTRLIGYSSFGKLYKGCLQHDDGSEYSVTIKPLYGEDNIEGNNQFNKEVELLCQLHHPNCVSLIGFCNHKKEKILVYEYMSNGSLDQYIQGKFREALSWRKRIEICIGVARGLHYLHAGAKRTIFHRDVCLSNILLDDQMEPKLAGFGRSIQGARFMSKPKTIPIDDDTWGSYGYHPMQHFRDTIVTDKCDVFTFGMLLLEIVWGRRYFAMKEIDGFLEKPVEENIDMDIKGKIAPECWKVFIDIIQRCVNSAADERPTMGEVELQLEYALSLQEQADSTNIHGDYILLSKTIVNLKP
ncbi:hypothetical protein PHAVU_008G029500 [Phaseolus vulgaris]|uniref:Protein kinase domain-containing protein n=1 Tax=Phaseolus vulgaris TaxID=3885 RepID=V7B3I1_PHAVU|nr:hypothetical protein PHAVU_008G029500g [Phaseolus vulgaris]ESW11433.1 hypothetical protein PHAVU_008G029500g [Phaseolus vulgaris]